MKADVPNSASTGSIPSTKLVENLMGADSLAFYNSLKNMLNALLGETEQRLRKGGSRDDFARLNAAKQAISSAIEVLEPLKAPRQSGL
jgi:hypothetical protein